jgi:hypothetical protein
MPGILRVKQPESSLPWRALALGLSALALALNGYAAFADPTARTRASTERVRAKTAASVESSTEAAPFGEPTLQHVDARRDSGSVAALETLIGLATKQDSPAAVDAIARIGGDRARQFLSERLASAADPDLATFASALATLGDPAARAALRSAARATRTALRLAALDALRTLDTPDVRELMLSALLEPEPLAATSYFADVREPRALPLLERLARVASPEVAHAAIDALSAQGASAQGAILRLLHDDASLADALLQAPARSAAAVQAVRNASIDRLRQGAITAGPIYDFMEQDLAASTRDALVLAAHDPPSSDSALSALVRRGDSASLLALSQLANDADPEVALRAGCTLVSNPDSRSRVLLQRATQRSLQKQVAGALVQINAPGARPI